MFKMYKIDIQLPLQSMLFLYTDVTVSVYISAVQSTATYCSDDCTGQGMGSNGCPYLDYSEPVA